MKTLNQFITMCVLLVISHLSVANDYTFTTYTSTKHINDIIQDGDVIWYATAGGIVKNDIDGNRLAEYRIDDGLPSNYINAIAIDKEGVKWFGTNKGIVKYDGTEWTVIENYIEGYMPALTINDLTFDKNNNLWVATDYGVHKFDGTEWSVFSEKNGLLENSCYSLDFDDSGCLWVATLKGIMKYDGTSWTNFTSADGLPNYKVTDVKIEDGNIVWATTWGGGVLKYDGSKWIVYTEDDGLLSNGQHSVTIAKDGTKYFGTNDGVSMFDGTEWSTYTKEDGLIYNIVNVIYIESNDALWFGTNQHGVSKYNGTAWEFFVKENEPATNAIDVVCIDVDGNIWGGDYEIVKFDGANWASTRNDLPMPKNNLLSMFSPADGSFWMLTFAQMLVKNNGQWDTLNREDWAGGSYANAMTEDFEGNLWIGQSNAIMKFDGEDFTRYESTVGIDRVNDIIADFDNNLWMGTDSGLVKYDGTKWMKFSKDRINTLALDPNGNVWAGEYWGDLLKVQNGTDAAQIVDGCPYVNLLDIVFDEDGVLWAGSNDGLHKFDGKTWTTYTQEDGLGDERVTAIAIDNDGVKWIGHNGITLNEGGLSKLEDGGAGPFSILGKRFVPGIVFYDKNENGVRDTDEPLLNNQSLEISPVNGVVSAADGVFKFVRNDGAYSIRVLPFDGWKCTTDESISFSMEGGLADKALAFGLVPKVNEPDFNVTITNGARFRVYEETKYWIHIENRGAASDPAVVTFTFEDKIEYQSASIAPSDMTETTLSWNIDALKEFETQQISIVFTVGGVEYIGDMVTASVNVSPNDNESVIHNNTASVEREITGSYDPNDKNVDKGVGEENYTLFDEKLRYTVRFQNTGNDTAFSVKIVDTLDVKLNPATFKFISSSHPLEYSIDTASVITFSFIDIVLPDSTTNEIESQGYLTYEITPVAGMDENEEVKNTAYIYFDYNPAIITNTVVNTYVSEIPSDDVEDETLGLNSSSVFSLSPNPVKNTVYINGGSSSGEKFAVYNSFGTEVFRGELNNSFIDVSFLPQGVYVFYLDNKAMKFIKE